MEDRIEDDDRRGGQARNRDAARTALLERILHSKPFQRSARIREFLTYVVAQQSAGRADQITEHHIGHALYGRPAGYNTAEDNIVRVDARRVRRALAEYFSGEGRDEPLRLTIPKGGYVPAYVPVRPPASTIDWKQWGTAALVGAAAAALVLAVFAPGGGAGGNEGVPEIWRRAFPEAAAVGIVLADTTFVLLRDRGAGPISIEEYLRRPHMDDTDGELRGRVANLELTTVTNVKIVADAIRYSGPADSGSRVLKSDELQPRAFREGHYLLIGGSDSNPWQKLFEPQRRIPSQTWDESGERVFAPRNPAAGESEIYRNAPPEAHYGVVAVLPNLTRSGSVLVVQGHSPAGTEGAWELLKHPALSAEALARVDADGDRPAKYFEILVRSRSVDGVATDPEYVTHRRLDGEDPVAYSTPSGTNATARVGLPD